MGLRRRNHSITLEKESRFRPGDLVSIDVNRKFPIGLREGPGYTYAKIEPIEPAHVGIVLDVQIGHGSVLWLCILGPQATIGWIPEGLVRH